MLDPDFLIKSLKLRSAKVVGDNLMSSCPFPDHDRYWNCGNKVFVWEKN